MISRKPRIRLTIKKGTTNKVVIMSHGFLSNKNTLLFKELSRLLNENGITTVRFNYNTEIISERVRILREVINKFNNNNVGLIGTSLGGMIVILNTHHPTVKSIALINTLYDLNNAYNNYIKVKPIAKPLVDLIKKELFNYNLKSIVKTIIKPTLIISGTKDRIIPTQVMKQLYLDLNAEKRLVLIHNCGHTIWRQQHLIRATEEVRDWFNKTLN